MADKVKILNHGQQTHVIGDLRLHPGQIEMPREVWEDLRGNSTIQMLLDDGQLEVRNKNYGTSKDGKDRKDVDLVEDLERYDFASERLDKSGGIDQGQYRNTDWLEAQIEALQAGGDANSRADAIEHIAGYFGVKSNTISKYTR